MKKILVSVAALFALPCWAQYNRVKDPNSIAWPQVYVTIDLDKRWQLLAEYQWRRTDGFRNWQQSLLRGAVQYKAGTQLSFAAGYGWIETFPYGDHPIASTGRFPEHRLHEQVQLKNNFGRLSLTQRLRIEQRWIGRRSAATQQNIDSWLFSHRFRYLVRLQHPVTASQKFYLAAANEVFIAAGKNVGLNTLDQNRLMLVAGAKMSDRFTLEAGYISQALIQSRPVDDRTIVQDNRGLLLSAYLQF